jgi:small subunit ribosomal protein S1
MGSKSPADERESPFLDEGWWEAVLAEEGGHTEGLESRSANRQGASTALNEQGPSLPVPDWKRARALFEEDQIVDLDVTAYNRGGLLVAGEELSGFVPFSHLVGVSGPANGDDRQSLLERYVGKRLRLKVIECSAVDGRIVLSERAAQAEPGRRPEIFRSLHPGGRAKGIITNITDFGAFVDLGGVEGLVHISELSWGRVMHPSQIVRTGQSVEVQILEVTPERCRVALSLKRLRPNPWDNIESELREAGVLSATITTVLSYGAFARLKSGVEGLIHVSEMPTVEGQSVKEFVKEGQTVEVRVIHIDATHQRMGLSMKLDA